MTKWLKRIREYWNDKKLAEKCGLTIHDICVHHPDGFFYDKNGDYVLGYALEKIYQHKCKKCGEFYK